MKIGITKLIMLVAVFVSSACSYVRTSDRLPASNPTINSTEEVPVFVDTADYDGIIVITQYYTFLGHGLHEEAYELLSTSARNRRSIDDYITNTRMVFQTVEIVSIQPYAIAVELQGGQMTPDPSHRKRFVAKIRAWGESSMSGSVSSGALQTLFLTLIEEKGTWKIDSFATAPLP